jgi:aminopeptidase
VKEKMMDPRIEKLAKLLVGYSLNLQPGEKVLISSDNPCASPVVSALIEEAYRAGGLPFFRINDQKLQRTWLRGAADEQMRLKAEWDTEQLKSLDAFLMVWVDENMLEMADVAGERQQKNSLYRQPLLDLMLTKKWCGFRYPTPAVAQSAGMSSEAFEDFLYRVSTLDYAGLSQAMDPLVALMERTDRVHIVGPGTDLSFSMGVIPVVKCDGKLNIPDGEVFSAPVRDSVNGVIEYGLPSVYQGVRYEDIRLEFREGKIVQAKARDNERINKVFDTDEGARYVGEFSVGVNPFIHRPMDDILFDEKICGSFHFTPGTAYPTANNGNRSAIHWDLVCIQTPDYGGGELWFDGVLVRKDGRWVVPELEPLNPEHFQE